MANKNSSMTAAVKATLVGGAIFLIPGFLAFFVLGKVFGLLKTVAATLGPQLGITTKAGGALLDLAVIAVILLVCFLAGLVARQATAQRVRTKVDQMLLGSFPGYAFVKGVAENIQHSEEMASSFMPALVRFDDYWQVAFETERTPEGIVAIYLPGAPNPWSGSVVYVLADRVSKLPVSITEALKLIRALGKGSLPIAAQIHPVGGGQ